MGGTVESYPWLNKSMTKTSHHRSVRFALRLLKEVTELQRNTGHDFAWIPRKVCVKEQRVRGAWGCRQCCEIHAHLSTLRFAAANGHLEPCRGHADRPQHLRSNGFRKAWNVKINRPLINSVLRLKKEEKALLNKRGNKLQQQLGAPRPRKAVRKLFLKASKDAQNKSRKDEAASSSRAAPPCLPGPSAERTKHPYRTDIPMTFDEQTELWTWKCSRCDVEFHGKETHKLEDQGRRHVKKHHAQAVSSPVFKHKGKLCWPCTVCRCKVTADTKARLKDRRRLHIDGFHPDCDISQFLTLGGKPGGSQRPGPKRVKALLDAAKERLVEEGIEPHPGPSIRGGASPKDFRLDYVNVNGYLNAAVAVANLRKQDAKPNIFCMAEVKANNAQRNSLTLQLRQLGYRTFWVHEPDGTRTRRGNAIAAGGIMVAVVDTEACAVLDKWQHTQGEMIHFDLGYSFLTVAWRRPGAERDQYDAEVNTLKLYAASKASPWMIVGDQNDLPGTPCWSSDLHLLAPKDDEGNYIASRWDGNRAVDWGAGNWPGDWHASFGLDKLGDHKQLTLTGAWPRSRSAVHQLVPIRHWQAPEGVPPAVWRAHIVDALKEPPEWKPAVDAQWSQLCAWAEDALRCAHHHACETAASQGRTLAGLRDGGRPSAPTSVSKAFRSKGSLAQCRVRKQTRGPNFGEDAAKLQQLGNFLGRLLEARRQQGKRGIEPGLQRKIRASWPADLARSDLGAAIDEIQRRLTAEQGKWRRTGLQRWRARMVKCGKEASTWLHGRSSLLPPAIARIKDGHNQIATTTAESLRFLKDFWREVWDRDTVQTLPYDIDADDNFDWSSEDGPLKAAELQRTAQTMTGGSAGPDGWSAAELASLPFAFWQQLEGRLEEWHLRAQYPRAWTQARMVCIPKDQLEPNADCVQVDRMRPISVLSAVYRVVASTWMTRKRTRAWLDHIMPADFQGGLQGRSAETGVRQLDAAYHLQPNILISMDFSLCFDYINPQLPLVILQRLGAPARMLSVLRPTWLAQTRWLQLGGITLPEGQWAGTSLPQGCPAAPMGLTVLLRRPAMDLRRLLEERLTQVIYLDERNVVVRTAQDAHTAIQAWQRYSLELGLRENMRKLRVITKDPSQQQALRRLGIDVHPEAKVLGTTFFSHVEQAPEHCERVEHTDKMTGRLRALPVGQEGRELMYRTRVAPAASWGFWFRPWTAQRCEVADTAARRAVNITSSAARALWQVLAGHQYDMRFFLRHSTVLSFLRAEWFWRRRGIQLPPGLWTQQVNADFRTLGFAKTGPWCWTHPEAGEVTWFEGTPQQEISKTGHALREAWRRSQLRAFLRMSRHEAIDLQAQGAAYCETQLSMTRRLYARATAEQRGVLLGGACSEANYAQKKRGARDGFCRLVRCGLCQERVVPTWDHAAWSCPHWQEGRLHHRGDPWTRRLGWSAPADSLAVAVARLQHLGRTREGLRQAFGFERGRPPEP